MGGFRFHDSLTREIRDLATVEPGVVRMYNCGPTVYGDQHIGNYRNYLCWDVLRRALELGGYKVRQIVNITDVGHLTVDDVADASGDDKLEVASKREKLDAWAIARKYEARYKADRRTLNMLEPERYPRATEHVAEMIAHVEELIRRGYAYATPAGNVYFEVAKFPAYGRLSGNTVEALDAGARVEVLDEKKDPADFALWKRDEKHQMQWDSPWGRGFPGWHIECSAMARKYLGDTLDIHTGGEDNAFPHHECEIAQSEPVTGKTFVGTWLHCRHLLVDGAKMSKSKGTMYSLEDVEKRGYSMRALRYFLMSAHYRAPMNFTWEGLDAAKSAVESFDASLRMWMDHGPRVINAPNGVVLDVEHGDPQIPNWRDRVRSDFLAALQDDLNVSGALAVVHEARKFINRLAPPTFRDWDIVNKLLLEFDSVLGVQLSIGFRSSALPGSGESVQTRAELGLRPDELAIDALVAERQAARKSKDFAKADAIRKELDAKGIVLEDTPQGVRWFRK